MSLLSPRLAWGCGALLVGAVWLSPVCVAQTLRDPTLSPAAAQSAADAGRQTPAAVNPSQVAILVRKGVPYLVHEARLYAVGDHMGAARIERLTETEVWLREAGALRKIRVFQGVERGAAAPAKAASDPHPARVSRP